MGLESRREWGAVFSQMSQIMSQRLMDIGFWRFCCLVGSARSL
ncbi:MAG: hypothetical protein ACTS3T_13810 [Almyronema sp.]|uniref:Uncharacterized protein n=1 Tax=Almyronema epifaneia S1 TaxID=2991925 RepID=A0ABW6ICK8_9CYAN